MRRASAITVAGTTARRPLTIATNGPFNDPRSLQFNNLPTNMGLFSSVTSTSSPPDTNSTNTPFGCHGRSRNGSAACSSPGKIFFGATTSGKTGTGMASASDVDNCLDFS
eukprot:CAMPEP_0115674370 /NCGR_PEP_ID=MMETSP0272-20121206/53588_1 /TAXON_ID=71861 /ORGANISM="Scrippsiella trochoidea, Strain CCMP3099" /LENGTH=109 /DNA_ID=CAMNT_0003113281 /DNA_START=205 /DNA_END=530 /DNA_ORIENTATION=-